MDILLLGIYSFFVWLIFIKLKLLPWNIYSQVTVVIIPIVALTVMILTLNVVAPSSADLRVFRYTIPIVSQVRGRVIEVAVEEGNRPVKKGDVLFRIDPTPYQLQVNALTAQLASAQGQQRELEEQLKGATASVAQAKSAIAQAGARVSEVNSKYDLAKKRVDQYKELLATGAGTRFDLEQAYPAAMVAVADSLPPYPGDVPAGLPSELLERRPDVVAAERRVAAAFYRTQEAKAARLPSIKLSANYTSINSELFVLKPRDNPIASLGAGIVQPLFLGGLLQSQVEVRTAEQRAAVADYGKVGQRAFNEVEGALAAGASAGDREKILSRSVSENDRALGFANVRYRVGSLDLRAVQQQQMALDSSRAALLRVRSERLVQLVNLHLALGGSFEPRPEPAPQPTASAY